MPESDIELEAWKGDLHPNSRIEQLEVATGGSVESAAPQLIVTDDLTLRPIFEPDFSEVCDLFIETDEEVFRHYSEPCYTLPGDIHDFVEQRRSQWEAGERFEYLVEYEGELIGKTYLRSRPNMSSYVLGLWLQRDYWGNGFSGQRADALIHVAFHRLNAGLVTVGTVMENQKSRRAIEKYISRYGGAYYGNVPIPEAVYHDGIDDPTAIVKHPEWAITAEDFETSEEGISTLIEGVEYEQIKFGSEHQ